MNQQKTGLRPPINITPRKQRNHRHPSLPQKLALSDTKPNYQKPKIYEGSPKTPNHQQFLTINQPINMKQSLIHYQRSSTNDQQILRITNAYENKLQSMAEEYYLYRKSTEQKMKELTRQKLHWQNIVTKINHHQQMWMQEQLNNQVAQRIEEEKEKFIHQKQQWRKQIDRVTLENFKLKQSLIEITHNTPIRSFFISQPMLTQPISNIQNQTSNRLSLSNPLHEQQMVIQQNQRMRAMIHRLESVVQAVSQQKVKRQLLRLNSKYNNLVI